MSGMSYEHDVIANLEALASRQQEALERIAARCDAVNYPPDLVVEIAALAHGGLLQDAPKGGPGGRPRGEARA
jgi:hypothetical protein